MKRFNLWLIAATASLVACTTQGLSVVARQAKVTAVSSDGVDLQLQLSARNLSGAELRGDTVAAKVVMRDGDELGSATAQSHQAVPPHGSADLVVPVSVPWKDVTLFFDVGSAGQDVPFTLDGKLALVGPSANSELPFRVKGVLPGEDLKQAMQKFVTRMVVE